MCRYLLSEQKNWRMKCRKERSTWWAASTALKQRQLIDLLRVASWFSSPGLAMLFYARAWKQITRSAPTIWSHFRTSPGHVGHRLVSLVSCVTARLSTLKTTCQISGVWCSCKFYGFEDVIGRITVVSDVVTIQSMHQPEPSNTRTIILTNLQ